jgi:hypothetical protein
MASLACRLYRLEHRLTGQPAERWVRDALLAAGRDDATPEPDSAPQPTSVRGDTLGDKQNAARVAWATIKLSHVGQRPVSLDQLATHVGLPAAETARSLRLNRQERIDLHDGMIRLERIDPPTDVVAVSTSTLSSPLDWTASTPTSARSSRTSPPHRPRRDGWLTTPRVGSLRCSPSTPKPAASSTGWRSQRQPPHCRERGRR